MLKISSLFEAYITNLGKYNEGRLVGETLKFPATTEEVQALLKRIGVDGVRYEEIFITSFDGDVLGLYDHLGEYPYVYVDGIYLRRNWGGEYENVAVLVAIAVNEDGFREVLGAAEGMKEDKASWVSFFQWLRGRGLDDVKLIVGDKCMGMLEAVGEVFPDAKYQRCTVHFYRNVFSVVPKSKVKIVAKMLKAIHAQESKKASREKAKAVVAELRAMKLKEAAKKVEDGIEETLTYCDFPSEHWTRIRTNNAIERLNREIRRRTRVVGTFPDGNSALMLVCARLRHVAGTQWGNKKYMNMKHLEAALYDASIAG